MDEELPTIWIDDADEKFENFLAPYRSFYYQVISPRRALIWNTLLKMAELAGAILVAFSVTTNKNLLIDGTGVAMTDEYWFSFGLSTLLIAYILEIISPWGPDLVRLFKILKETNIGQIIIQRLESLKEKGTTVLREFRERNWMK